MVLYCFAARIVGRYSAGSLDCKALKQQCLQAAQRLNAIVKGDSASAPELIFEVAKRLLRQTVERLLLLSYDLEDEGSVVQARHGAAIDLDRAMFMLDILLREGQLQEKDVALVDALRKATAVVRIRLAS